MRMRASPVASQVCTRAGASQRTTLSGRRAVATTRTVDPDQLRAFAKSLLKSAGSSEEEAATVSANLVEANLKGVDSHGVQGQRAMQRGIECARTFGVSVVKLKNCHHLGRIGAYAESCARANCVSIHFTNVAGHEPLVACASGKEARLGTNPFTVGCPNFNAEVGVAGEGASGRGSRAPPIVLDYATSAMALGKVREYMGRSELLPENQQIVLDAEGRLSRDPSVMFPPGNSTVVTSAAASSGSSGSDSSCTSGPPPAAGALLPFADHKGYALSFLCEVLGGALTGGNTIHPKYRRDQGLIINSMFTVIVDVGPSALAPAFGNEVRLLTEFMKSAALRQGCEGREILIPGELEQRTFESRTAAGVLPLSLGTLRELVATAKDVGVAVPAGFDESEVEEVVDSYPVVPASTMKSSVLVENESTSKVKVSTSEPRTSLPRISAPTRYTGPLVEADKGLTERQREIRDDIVRSRPRTGFAQGPFSIWMASPEVCDASQKLGKVCRYGLKALAQHETELIILFVGAWTRCVHEIAIHESEALRAGVREKVVEKMKELLAKSKEAGSCPGGRAALFNAELFENEDAKNHLLTKAELLLLRLCFELLEKQDIVDDELYAEAVQYFGGKEQGLVELISLVSYYQYIALTLNTFRPPRDCAVSPPKNIITMSNTASAKSPKRGHRYAREGTESPKRRRDKTAQGGFTFSPFNHLLRTDAAGQDVYIGHGHHYGEESGSSSCSSCEEGDEVVQVHGRTLTAKAYRREQAQKEREAHACVDYLDGLLAQERVAELFHAEDEAGQGEHEIEEKGEIATEKEKEKKAERESSSSEYDPFNDDYIHSGAEAEGEAEAERKRRILITGATSALGQHIIAEEVKNCMRASSGDADEKGGAQLEIFALVRPETLAQLGYLTQSALASGRMPLLKNVSPREFVARAQGRIMSGRRGIVSGTYVPLLNMPLEPPLGSGSCPTKTSGTSLLSAKKNAAAECVSLASPVDDDDDRAEKSASSNAALSESQADISLTLIPGDLQHLTVQNWESLLSAGRKGNAKNSGQELRPLSKVYHTAAPSDIRATLRIAVYCRKHQVPLEYPSTRALDHTVAIGGLARDSRGMSKRIPQMRHREWDHLGAEYLLGAVFFRGGQNTKSCPAPASSLLNIHRLHDLSGDKKNNVGGNPSGNFHGYLNMCLRAHAVLDDRGCGERCVSFQPVDEVARQMVLSAPGPSGRNRRKPAVVLTCKLSEISRMLNLPSLPLLKFKSVVGGTGTNSNKVAPEVAAADLAIVDRLMAAEPLTLARGGAQEARDNDYVLQCILRHKNVLKKEQTGSGKVNVAKPSGANCGRSKKKAE
eukprot:g4650.t1